MCSIGFGRQTVPFDRVLAITPYQQTSMELMRLGCLLAAFLPFELAVQLLVQLCGIRISDDTVWHWVQTFGQQAMQRIDTDLVHLANGVEPSLESVEPAQSALPLVIAADGVSVPFRAYPGIANGKIRFRDVH